MAFRDVKVTPFLPENHSAVERFRQSFNAGEIKKRLVDSFDVRALGEQEIYTEDIGDGIQYQITFGEGILVFHLIDKTGDILANFICEPSGNRIKFTHREVVTNLKEETGISGSDYLKKAEDFLRIFLDVVEAGMDKEKRKKFFEIEAGQIKVIEWADKNHYHIEDAKQKKLLDQIKAGVSHIITDEFARGNLFKGYIIKTKEDYDRLVGLRKSGMDESEFRREVIRCSERFKMVKDI